MDVFELREKVVADYEAFVTSFMQVRDPRVKQLVDEELAKGHLWPEPRIALNPAFASGGWVDELVQRDELDPACSRIFRLDKGQPDEMGLRLRRHQAEAIEVAKKGEPYVLTTGTGSGKSLAYIIPIVDAVLRAGKKPGIKAICVYPMNALANSQAGELEKFLLAGFPDGQGPVSFKRYTGQENDEERKAIIADPPDILLTNYVMLELILTRVDERQLVEAATGLQFLVLDELHTYRGRQGADVALLVRRVREATKSPALQCIGTSATMMTDGNWAAQQKTVAEVASKLFGQPVAAGNVIGETLERATTGDLDMTALKDRVRSGYPPPDDPEAFRQDPLSVWLEFTFGVCKAENEERLARQKPRTIGGTEGAAVELAQLTGMPEAECAATIRRHLMAGNRLTDSSGSPIFAFKVHQFVSRGDTVWASLEPEESRHLTVDKQSYVPGDRQKVLRPLTFCRECGQDYYAVRLSRGNEPLDEWPLSDREPSTEESRTGYLYASSSNPWPQDRWQQAERLPEDWVGDNSTVKPYYREHLPRAYDVLPDATARPGHTGTPGALRAWFVSSPLRFCLACGVTYSSRTRSDFSKLTTLGSEGRSSATTVLALSAVRYLRTDAELPRQARKLLCFSDNRQDASLQAGHINDFIEVGLLRSALYRAALAAGPDGLSHDVLTYKVAEALGLSLAEYASNPDVRFSAREQTDRALRDVLGYSLYLDQRRGWRVTSPNLEQTGLLRIEWQSLGEVCAAEDVWSGSHPVLAGAAPGQREELGRTLLDWLRRELAIKVEYLSPNNLDLVRQRSSQWLKEPWALDEDGRLDTATVAYPRARSGDDRGRHVYLSGRSGFGQYLARRATGPEWALADKLGWDDRQRVIRDLLAGLKEAGLVEVVEAAPGHEPEAPGYQVNAATMLWVAGDGETVAADPIRVPRAPKEGRKPNRFFLDFYRSVAGDGRGLRAREHTAQVPAERRQEREREFSDASLPLLVCSPTMELGVDIAQLNVVGLRNVPPTPANYAQRSGRAGRSGQPALVITYCSTGSPHDQWFFRRPDDMVAGSVAPPRVDLANEDLVRAHVQAMWLAASHLSLGRSLLDVLDVEGDPPSLDLSQRVQDELARPGPKVAAHEAATAVLADLVRDLSGSNWYSEGWLDDVLRQLPKRFSEATDRWRTLYRAARSQAVAQQQVILDANKSQAERNYASRLRKEAEQKMRLLESADDKLFQSDFYVYRYFASEGFLPGYSFPRLPLCAYIPGRRERSGADEYVSRARFLAVNEFGPRNLIYYEGSRYRIYRSTLPVRSDEGDGLTVLTEWAKLCAACGYMHPAPAGVGPDLCERCGKELPAARGNLFRMQNVDTRRVDRINSDEEERARQGYEIRTSLRFSEGPSGPAVQSAEVTADGAKVAALAYGHAAEIWRLNLGWRRRSETAPDGFLIDAETGVWAAKQDVSAGEAEDEGDPLGPAQGRVVPFVADTRNCLVVDLQDEKDKAALASVQEALRTAMLVSYQLEANELDAEALPSWGEPSRLLFFEAAEGGAGVLRRLVEEPEALSRLAAKALEICHIDPGSGRDLPNACEGACYRCLLSYGNQPLHKFLDRRAAAERLELLARAKVAVGEGPLPRAEHLARLRKLAQSDLEQRFLDLLEAGEYRLPSEAQPLFPELGARPDFLYKDTWTVVYIDGPHHQYPDRAKRDSEATSRLKDAGWEVLRLGLADDWEAVVRGRPDVFGSGLDSGPL